MSNVQPTLLQQLFRQRLREMGDKRGRDEPLTLAEAYRAVKNPEVTYEVLRRVETDGHTNIGDKAVRTIATMLGVDENEVRRRAGQRPRLGRFELPARADRLQQPERAAVVAIVDAILDAAEGRREESEPTRRGELGLAADQRPRHPAPRKTSRRRDP